MTMWLAVLLQIFAMSSGVKVALKVDTKGQKWVKAVEFLRPGKDRNLDIKKSLIFMFDWHLPNDF